MVVKIILLQKVTLLYDKKSILKCDNFWLSEFHNGPDTQKNRIWQEKNKKCKNIHDELLAEMTPESQQLIKGAIEKGASSWLSALPIKAIGYALNKQEFTDAICIHAWDMDGRWKAYPLTVLVERQILWITASYAN